MRHFDRYPASSYDTARPYEDGIRKRCACMGLNLCYNVPAFNSKEIMGWALRCVCGRVILGFVVSLRMTIERNLCKVVGICTYSLCCHNETRLR